MPAKGKTNWNDFTKAELIRTIKRLDKRQTELLNEIMRLKQRDAIKETCDNHAVKYPWETAGRDMPNPFEGLK